MAQEDTGAAIQNWVDHSCDFVPEGMPTKEYHHFVLMLHGLGGNSGDWHAVIEAMRKNWDTGIMVLRTNIPNDMGEGIEHAARLVLPTVRGILEGTFPPGHDLECSLVTVSFGGLYGRYLIKLLVDEGLLCGSAPAQQGRLQLRARAFISIATPHLGVRWAKPQGVWGAVCHGALKTFAGPNLAELLLEDEPPHTLCELAEGEFIAALSLFKRRACYANVKYDPQVLFFTAAIEYKSPFENCSDSDLPRLEGFQSIIDTDAAVREDYPQSELAYFANDSKREELTRIRENLHGLGWTKLSCILPMIPNAHNAIIGNCIMKDQGLDVADHIAKMVLKSDPEPLESFLSRSADFPDPTLAEWRYEGSEFAALVLQSWSKKMKIDDCIAELEKEIEKGGKPVFVKVPAGRSSIAQRCATPQDAIAYLKAHDPARKDLKGKIDHLREVVSQKFGVFATSETAQKEAQKVKDAAAAALAKAEEECDAATKHLEDAKVQLEEAQIQAADAEAEAKEKGV